MESLVGVSVDSTSTKRSIIEAVKEIHLRQVGVYLIPQDTGGLNTSFFVTDVFRRCGHYVQTMSGVNQYCQCPLSVNIFICHMSNTVLEKQITREDTLESLQNDYSTGGNGSYKLIRACGTACSTAWLYAMWLMNSNQWRLCGEMAINAIPVKIDNKTIYKTTIQINLQKMEIWNQQ